MTLLLISAAASFAYVFMRALQQLNVQGGHYYRVVPTSVVMGIGDVVLITLTIKVDSLWLGVTNGLAAGCGCMLAMWLNSYWRKKIK